MPEFILGFKALAELIPDVVGEPLEGEHHDVPNGDGLQQTTRGLMVWRKDDNWTAFTDGYRTWVNGPKGLQQRLNSERFDWELRTREIPIEEVWHQLPVAPWNELRTRDTDDITLLVVHWDGGAIFRADYNPLAYYEWEARYHIAKDWGGGARGYGLMYHEVIDRTGKVWCTRRAGHVVWAQTLANPVGYAIKVDACQGSPPSDPQMWTLKARLDMLRRRFGLGRSAVHGHGELRDWGNMTDCPGPDLLRFVQGYRAG